MIKILLPMLVCATHAYAQISFTVKDINPENNPIENGLSIGVCDVNGDLYDDVIALDQGKDLWIGIQATPDRWLWKSLGRILTQPNWSVCVGDLNNDGLNDLVVGGDYEGILLFYQKQDLEFDKTTIKDSKFLTQGSTISDINVDGFLDIIVCDDVAKPRVYINLKNTFFEEDSTIIDFSIDPVLYESGNYSVSIADIDGDDDQDIYISKCRGSVDDPTDLRRINRLYINEPSGFFEKGAEFNLNDGNQTWTTDFGDMDNDGDLDALIIEHGSPCQLMENVGNKVFVNINASAGFNVNGVPIQGLFRDFDNDGDLDILIAGSESIIAENLGNKKFQILTHLFGFIPFASCAVGDLNHDGFSDIYAAYPELLNNPKVSPNLIWFGQPNQNHFLDIALKGIRTNPNGIGAKIWVHSGGGFQYRQLSSGESYGIQNSHNVHFGLNSHTAIDSLVILWPSGIKNTYINLDVDRLYVIVENTCIGVQAEIELTGDVRFCDGDSIILSAKPGLAHILWSDGASVTNRIERDSKFLFYSGLDSIGCPIISQSIFIEKNPKELPRLNYSGEIAHCGPLHLDLKIEGYSEVTWSTLDTTASIIVTGSGQYFAKVEGLCEEFYSDTLEYVELIPPAIPVLIPIAISKPEILTLMVAGMNISWYRDKHDIVPIHVGSVFTTDTIRNDTFFWVEANSIHQYQSICGGEKNPKNMGTNSYHADDISGKMSFEVFENCILNSVHVYSETKGLREIQLLDNNGNVIDSLLFFIEELETKVPLYFKLDKGSYALATNSKVNMNQFGSESPKLKSSDLEVYYPYNVHKLMRITGCSRGLDVYDYFYNWDIRLPDEVCPSERAEQKISFATHTNQGVELSQFRIFANPSYTEEITIFNPTQDHAVVEFYTMDAKVFKTSSLSPGMNYFNLFGIDDGIYFIKIMTSTKSFGFKWIKF